MINEIVDIYDALKIISSYSVGYQKELVQLKEALGKSSYENIYAPVNDPLWRRSKIDGFACKLDSDFLKPFKIVGDISASGIYEGILNSNECIHIATGSKVPDSADIIIRVEDTYKNIDTLYLNKYDNSIDYIEDIGSLIKSGQLLISKDRLIDHRDIEILAKERINSLYINSFPHVGILSTGSEITDKFYFSEGILNSNYYGISSLLDIYNVPYSNLGICDDDINKLKDAIALGVKKFDALISFGGTGYSKYDLMKEVIHKLEGKVIIDGLNSNPGKTFRFAIVNDKPIFILPGTPQGAMACSELFILSWLKGGIKEIDLIDTVSDFTLKKRSGFYRLLTTFTDVYGGKLTSQKREEVVNKRSVFRSISIIPKDIEVVKKGDIHKSFLVYYM